MKRERCTCLAEGSSLQVMHSRALGQGAGSFCTLCCYKALHHRQRGEQGSKQCGQHGKNWQVLLPSQYSYMFYIIAQSTLTPDYDTCGSVNLRTIQRCEVSHFIRYRSVSANFVL